MKLERITILVPNNKLSIPDRYKFSNNIEKTEYFNTSQIVKFGKDEIFDDGKECNVMYLQNAGYEQYYEVILSDGEYERLITKYGKKGIEYFKIGDRVTFMLDNKQQNGIIIDIHTKVKCPIKIQVDEIVGIETTFQTKAENLTLINN